MEHVYRGFRISVREDSTGYHAKFWRVSGAPISIRATSTLDEGSSVCLARATAAIDQFILYVTRHSDA